MSLERAPDAASSRRGFSGITGHTFVIVVVVAFVNLQQAGV